MNSVASKTLCWNCDGEVETDAGKCRYCGVNLGGLDNNDGVSASAPSTQQQFTPPYTLTETNNTQTAPQPPYLPRPAEDEISVKSPPSEWKKTLSSKQTQQVAKRQMEKMTTILAPMAMLLSGSVFMLFGLVMFLFSENGKFTLQWNASYAAFYLIAASSLLYFGWKALGNVEEESP